MKEEIVDPSMDIAYKLANELGDCPAIPASISNPNTAAEYVDLMDDVIAQVSGYYDADGDKQKKFMDDVSKLSAEYMSDIDDPLQMVNLTLRIWSGCIAAAKTIALETRNGPNTPEIRHDLFSGLIDVRAKKDDVYSYGVSIAPILKESMRDQEFSLEGVPSDSVVRAHVTDNV